MPELPEVETIKRGLENKIVNKKLEKIWIEPSFEKKVSPDAKQVQKALKNQKIKNVWRRAKLIVFDLSNDLYVLIHLKMTGQLVYKPTRGSFVSGGHPIKDVASLPFKFSRFIFYFQDKSILFFNDIRKFGFIKVVDDTGLAVEVEKYGLEPLDKEFSLGHFSYLLSLRPGMKIKQFLLEQKLISGLGNIYADEALFDSKIKPLRRVGSLKDEEKELLYKSVRSILKKAIKYNGTTVSDYVSSTGHAGKFQNYLKVYGRAGGNCKRCGAILTKTKLGGRTTTYCPACQK